MGVFAFAVVVVFVLWGIHLGLLSALEVSRCGLGACWDPMVMNWGCYLKDGLEEEGFSIPCSLLPGPCFSNVAAGLAALFEVALVVFLGAPEGLGRLNLGDDALRLEAAFVGELLDLGLGLGFLLGRVEEDGRPVLRAPVGTLAVHGGRVVQSKERVKELRGAGFLVVEGQFHYFNVDGGGQCHGPV